MPMLTLTGGPVAPSGEALAGATRLVVTFCVPYRDEAGAYPQVHTAALDATNGSWKPVGAADGTAFQLPGAEAGNPGPLVTLEEVQVHADGSEVTSRRLARLVEAADGTIHYADPSGAISAAAELRLDFRNPDAAVYAATIL